MVDKKINPPPKCGKQSEVCPYKAVIKDLQTNIYCLSDPPLKCKEEES